MGRYRHDGKRLRDGDGKRTRCADDCCGAVIEDCDDLGLCIPASTDVEIEISGIVAGPCNSSNSLENCSYWNDTFIASDVGHASTEDECGISEIVHSRQCYSFGLGTISLTLELAINYTPGTDSGYFRCELGGNDTWRLDYATGMGAALTAFCAGDDISLPFNAAISVGTCDASSSTCVIRKL